MKGKNSIKYIGFSLIALIVGTCCEVSDWEYKYYYYVKVDVVPGVEYDIQVPLPKLTYRKYESTIKPEYLEHFSDGLKIEKGECVYGIVEYNNWLFLQIKGCSSTVVSSSFKLWNVFLGRLIAKKSKFHTLIYSNNDGVKIVVEFRCVQKTNELETWNLYYSVISDTSHRLPILTKRTWRVSLPDTYYILLKEGWNDYLVRGDMVEIK